MSATRDEICVVACAEAFRGDGEILVSAFGSIPVIGARLARATFEPDLLLSDGEASLVANTLPLAGGEKVVEGWLPFRDVFGLVAAGRRHVMMVPSQIDRFGNANISCIGAWERPKTQLIGCRGGPGNTVNHATSYWVPSHGARTFVERVDFVGGLGNDRGAADLRRVVTNLCVLDFETPDGSMRLRSIHPGVTADEVVAATGFEPVIPKGVPVTRAPTDDELRLIRGTLDPGGLRKREVA